MEKTQKVKDFLKRWTDEDDGKFYLKPSLLRTGYQEFTEVTESIFPYLIESDRKCLAAWGLLDLRESPMDDERRKLIREYFWAGFNAAN